MDSLTESNSGGAPLLAAVEDLVDAGAAEVGDCGDGANAVPGFVRLADSIVTGAKRLLRVRGSSTDTSQAVPIHTSRCPYCAPDEQCALCLGLGVEAVPALVAAAILGSQLGRKLDFAVTVARPGCNRAVLAAVQFACRYLQIHGAADHLVLCGVCVHV